MHAIRTALGSLLGLALLLSACSSSSTTTAGGEPDEEAPGGEVGQKEEPGSGPGSTPSPPPIVVVGPGGDLELEPFTYCWSFASEDGAEGEQVGICADGAPPDPLPEAGPFSEPVRFEFPLADWTFTASMGPGDGSSGGKTDVTAIEPGAWEIELAGAAGRSEVMLSGFGPAGDVHVAFAIELLTAGAEPEPTADFAGFFGDLDGRSAAELTESELAAAEVTATAFSLVIAQLADDRSPAATVVVTAANGAAGRVDLEPARDGADPEGNGAIALMSTEAEARELLALGPPPYDFEVTLTVGPTTHVATFSYPDDLNAATTSWQPTFEPPLPTRSDG